MTQTEARSPYAVRVTNFKSGPRYARELGGRFDWTSKLWTIPASEKADRYLSAASAYGLQVVAAPSKDADPYQGQMCPRCHSVCYGDCRS